MKGKTMAKAKRSARGRATCKYIVRKDGGESFLLPQWWSSCRSEGRPMPGHLVLVTGMDGFLVVRVPRPHQGSHGGLPEWRLEEQMWRKMIQRLGLEWWTYLKPVARPPASPKKKHYRTGELGLGFHDLKIVVNDQEVE